MAPRRAVVVATVLAAASLVGWLLGRYDAGRAADPDAPGPQRIAARVVEAVDGDTVHVRTARGTDTVRLLGVDTPETHHPTKGVQCFGPEAAAFTESALLGRSVTLELDVEHRDLYGRLLAYVWVGDSRFNDVLLRRGYARLLVIPPNGADTGEAMLAEELTARRARRGLWGAC
jgi:micrococcal nuclease